MKLLDSNDITPLYIQLSDQIRLQIEQGTIQYGHQIPSEAQLCEQYEVSRVTVRNAVELLVKEGALIKRQGKGTYVAFPELEERMINGRSDSFSEAFSQISISTSTKIVDKKIINASTVIGKRLHLPVGESVIRIQRIRYVNNIPAVFEEDFFPMSFDFLMQTELKDLSLFSLIFEKTGIHPKIAMSSFSARSANENHSKWLNVATGEALLFISQIISDSENEILYYNEQTICSDVYKYVVKS